LIVHIWKDHREKINNSCIQKKKLIYGITIGCVQKRRYQMGLLSLFIIGAVLWFGVISLISGLFAAYFGAGKSRSIGVILLLIGMVFIAFVVVTQHSSFGGLTDVMVVEHLIGILGALVGGIIGLLLFLYCIMKA